MIAFKDITITGIDGIGNDINLVKSLKYSKQFFPNAKLKLKLELTTTLQNPNDSKSQLHNSNDLKIINYILDNI